MNLYKKNLKKQTDGNVYNPRNENDACRVGFVATTEAKKSRKVVEFGIQALPDRYPDSLLKQDTGSDLFLP